MSDSITMINTFRYPQSYELRMTDNQQMAQLNYMTSRIRAALCKYEEDLDKVEGSEEWWWESLQKELVTYKIKL